MSKELISKLFEFTKEVKIKNQKLYLRIPGDNVVEEARRESLLESRKLRRSLRTPDSDDYLIHLDPVEDYDKDEIIAMCLTLGMRDVMRTYIQTHPKPQLTSLGDNPSLEDQEQHEAEKVQRDIDYNDNMRLHIENWRDSYNKTLNNMDIEQVKNVYKRLKTERVCEDTFNREFEDRIMTYSIYTDKDHKKPAFTIDEYRNLPSNIKTELQEEYGSISLGSDELKK